MVGLRQMDEVDRLDSHHSDRDSPRATMSIEGTRNIRAPGSTRLCSWGRDSPMRRGENRQTRGKAPGALQRRMAIYRVAESEKVSTIGLRKNLEMLAVDKIVVVYQEIAGVFHFASDLFFLDSVTE